MNSKKKVLVSCKSFGKTGPAGSKILKNAGLDLVINKTGEKLNEEALFYALENKIIAGAALDVFQNEPYHGQLAGMNNVVLTPHIGSATIETRRKMDIESAENLIRGLKRVGIL